jgi:ribosomal protein S18 acetylase RimI-like enzyme
MSEIVCLRPAGLDDLPSLFVLDQRCFRQGISYSQAELASILDGSGCVSVVAEGALGEVLGLWMLETCSRYKIAHILTIEVAPHARSRGLGTLLMAHLEQTACLLQLDRVRLEVAEDDRSAQQFYLRLGYRAIGRFPRYYMGRINAIRMEKQLRV